MSEDLATAQSDMASLSQTADLVSQSIALEAANALKQRIQQLKANSAQLSDVIRQRSNLFSDALAERYNEYPTFWEFPHGLKPLFKETYFLQSVNMQSHYGSFFMILW